MSEVDEARDLFAVALCTVAAVDDDDADSVNDDGPASADSFSWSCQQSAMIIAGSTSASKQ